MALVDRSKIAAAAEQNVQRMRKNEPARLLYTAFDGEYELRQRFRKRIDREVLELNAPKLALQSLQVRARTRPWYAVHALTDLWWHIAVAGRGEVGGEHPRGP